MFPTLIEVTPHDQNSVLLRQIVSITHSGVEALSQTNAVSHRNDSIRVSTVSLRITLAMNSSTGKHTLSKKPLMLGTML